MSNELELKHSDTTEELSVLEELSKVEKKLTSLVPIRPTRSKLSPHPCDEAQLTVVFMATTLGLLTSSLVAVIIQVGLFPAILTSLSFGLLSGFVSWNAVFADGNPKHKVRRFFEKIFYSKKARQALRRYHLSHTDYKNKMKSYKEAKEMHTALIQQEIELLKQRGIFEKQGKTPSSLFWHINPKGKVDEIGALEYADYYLDGAPVDYENISNDLLQNKIVKAIIANHEESQKLTLSR